MSRRKGEAPTKERPAKRRKKDDEEKKKVEPLVFTRLVDRARYVRGVLRHEHELERLKKVVEEWVEEEDPDDWDKDGKICPRWMTIDMGELGPKGREFLRWMNDHGFPMVFNGPPDDDGCSNLCVYLHEADANNESDGSFNRRVVESDWTEQVVE
jgi:hypothetical protein